MWNDEEKLHEELNWTPRGRSPEERARERTPRGVTAIMAMGGALMLPMWGVTMNWVGSESDLAFIKLMLVFALEGCVALWIAQVIWRLMGPIPRTLIRPLMILGPLPPLAIICCSGLGIGMSTGATTRPHPNLVTRGKNWGIPQDGELVRLSKAQDLCAKLGTPWRIPREDELARLEPMPPAHLTHATHLGYWLLPAPGARSTGDVFLRVVCRNKQCTPETQREQKDPRGETENEGAALCVNF